MTHTLTPEISAILAKWDKLGLPSKRDAAEFILANKDWKELIKGVAFEDADCAVVNKWRERFIQIAKDIALNQKGIQ